MDCGDKRNREKKSLLDGNHRTIEKDRREIGEEMKKNQKIESKEQLIKYCEFLESHKDKGEWERGYRYGVSHIKDQLKKSIFRWG